MLNRTVAGLVVALAFTGAVFADVIRGGVTKVEDGSITIRTRVVRSANGKSIATFEEKTFKIGKDVKVARVMGTREPDVELTIAELKTAVKVVNRITVAITHEGGKGSVIKVLPAGKGG